MRALPRATARMHGTVPRVMTAVLFAHPRCDTCRHARRWLDTHAVAVEVIDLTVRAPTPAELRAIQRASGLPLRKLFNTSGQSYRAGGFGPRIAAMDDEAMIAALAADGMLVRRPILVRGPLALVGFAADVYARALA
jgi:arsenate reductase